MQEATKEPEVRRVQTCKLVTDLVNDYYKELRHAPDEGRKVAWTCGPAPFELLRTMDVAFQHGESYGAYAAARKGQVELKEAAVRRGYPQDACSYVRTINGLAMLNLEGVPVRPDMWVPNPDFVVGSNVCHTVGCWSDSLGRLFNVPSFVIDIPIAFNPSQYEENIDFVEAQLTECISLIEEVVGRRFNYDRLEEIMNMVKQASTLRRVSLDLCANRPSPMSYFDWLFALNPMHVWRGTPKSVDFFEKLKIEIEQRVADKVGAVSGEKYRLYWDNLPIWHKLDAMSKKFASFGATLICGVYTHGLFYSDPSRIDPSNPLRSIAEELVIIASLFYAPNRIDFIYDLVEKYSLDGLVMHSARTCRPMDTGQYDIMTAIDRKLGLPSIMIEADPTDPDFWSEAQVDTRLQAFAEALESRNKNKY